MKGNRAAAAAVIAVVLVLGGWWLFRGGSSASTVALVDQLGAATKSPASAQFEVIDADLNGEVRRAITANPPTRLTFKVQVPDDGWLKVAVGMKPEAWTQEGNGVLFFVGVSDTRTFETLFTQHVNPFGNPGDRKWIPVWVDLSAYAGEQIDLIFNTRSSPADVADDPRNDLALWGSPEIVVR
jgi:hypothetical protein